MPKEAALPDLARWFQAHDVTVLIYDSRGLGASEGEPRNYVSVLQRNDLSDNRMLIYLPVCRLMHANKFRTFTMH
jgi:hypothetical protein